MATKNNSMSGPSTPKENTNAIRKQFNSPELIHPKMVRYSRDITVGRFSNRHNPISPIIRLQGNWLEEFALFHVGMDVQIEAIPGAIVLRSFRLPGGWL